MVVKNLNYVIRPLTQQDEPFLWQMLYEAAHLAEEGNLTVQDAMNHPELLKYVENWGLPGDMGFAATLVDSDVSVGAAWLRLFTKDNQGYGYIDDQTPELAMAFRPAKLNATLPQYRNQGIGTKLITHLITAAKVVYPAIALSSRKSNPALRLYQRLGWQIVPGSETVNRVGSISLKMKLDLATMLEASTN
ncbi:GCN5-related N-acetyltransferase [Nostoc sp. NIES-3756]|uniref:GNAT family N-acetyltransferase n=1 Tax=Nostoc sp. NIES-3756 TaxID=1751286 RepID=UPI00071EC410|nr:GNAT family N-acetyltransferase [Nostoc sp. NIES-3756]BAT54843.1 GCN5-related N-acetyltransferase [Nostoc sp. NIES-3756]